MMSRIPEEETRSGWRKSKKLLFFLLIIAGVAFFARGAVRDIALGLSQSRIAGGIPDSVLENITLEREIAGDLWKGNVKKVERGKGWADLFSISVEVKRRNGQVLTLVAPSGRYLDGKMQAEVSSPTGTFKGEEMAFTYAAPLASWSQKTGTIVFPRGFIASGDRGEFRGSLVEMFQDGILEARKGASIRWHEQGGGRE